MVTVAESSLAVFLGSLGGRYEEKFPLVGRARCTAKAPTTRLELAAACVAVTHTPFGQFPSFLRWLLRFSAASLPANATAELTVAGMNGGQPVRRRSTGSTGTGRAERRHQLFRAEAGTAARSRRRRPDTAAGGEDRPGAGVTSVQGVIAGTCP